MQDEQQHQRVSRESLVVGAVHVFAAHGYRVPIRTLAAELGVTTGAIYHHFGSKRELFLEVVAAAFAEDAAEAVLPPPGGTASERARALAELVRAREQTWITRVLTLHEFVRSTEGPPAPHLLDAMDRYAAWVAAFLGSTDPQVGIFANNWLTGMVLRRRLDAGRTTWEAQVEVFVAAIEGVLDRG